MNKLAKGKASAAATVKALYEPLHMETNKDSL